MIAANPTASVTDLQSLAALRMDARENSAEAGKVVAQQFESLFIQIMLKSMREATIPGGLFDSDQMDTYYQMFDQQVALDVANKGGVGLSSVIEEQLGQRALIEDTQDPQGIIETTASGSERPLHTWFETIRSQASTHLTRIDENSGVQSGAGITAQRGAEWRPESPAEFVRSVWSSAVEAGKALGVDPKVLVAQSALETGWGKKVPVKSTGESSLNLFGVKATHHWSGDSVAVPTLEYRDGVARREYARFRAYDSVADSFSNYVELLSGSPRYQKALDMAGDSAAFVEALQDAGYATDPAYAKKIQAIMNSDHYESVVDELKNSENLPITG